MSLNTLRSLRRMFWLGAAAAVAAITLSACASSSGGGGTAPAAAGSAGGSTAASAALTIETHSGPLGTFLTDGNGKTLYMFAADSATASTCTAQCVVFWPPVTDAGSPTVSGNASMSDVGSIARADGSKQVTYDGHPLYYYKNDTAAGDTNGQGSNTFGAKWWVLSPQGAPIKASGGSAAGAPSPASKPSKTSKTSPAPAGGGWG